MFRLTRFFQRIHLFPSPPGSTRGSTCGHPSALGFGWVFGAVLLGSALLGVGTVQAQTGTVTGAVIDTETGETLPGANVRIAGTNQGAATNPEGRYRIEGVEPGTYRLRASFVGYQSKEVEGIRVRAGETTQVSFRLRPGVQGDEVVVVAYGQQQRGDVTGSFSSVEAGDLEGTATTSLEQGLQGQLAGVDVTQGNAAPGGGIQVQIRGVTSTLGNNEPLFVVDGVPLNNSPVDGTTLSSANPDNQVTTDTNPLATLAPSDIESIQVLKDASATSMYGSRASNGVVLITTKDGTGEGEFSMNYSRSFSTPTKQIDVLDAAQFARYRNEVGFNANGEDGIVFGVDDPSQGDPRTVEFIRDSVQTIDWQDRIFQVAATDDVGLEYSGGSENGSYNLRGTLLRQEGVIKGSEFLRGGFRANVNREVTENIEVQAQANLTRSTNDIVRTATNNSGAAGGAVRGALQFQPLEPFRQGECPFEDERRCLESEDPFNTRQGPNPLRFTDEVKLDQSITRGVVNLQTLVDLSEKFTLDLSVSSNFNNKQIENFFPNTVAEGEQTNGEGTRSSNDFLQITTENFLRYENEFGIHEVDALAGGSFEDNKNEFVRATGTNFPDNVLGRNTLDPAQNQQLSSGDQEWRLASGMSRINYSLMDRYNLTASFRADGSSKFAVNNKWGFFPSVGVAWQAIQEPFLEDVGWLSNLKLRASWGETGNQAIGPFQSKAQLSQSTTQFNNEIVSTAEPTNLPNPNLQWEETEQYNIGLDMAFLDNRLRVTTDVYRKTTTDLLQQISLAPNSGFRTTLVNSGEVRNQGIEFQIGGDILTGDVRWSVDANMSHNDNEIQELPVERQFASRLGSGRINFSPFIQTEGEPIGAIFGYETDGLYRSQEELENDPAAPSDAQVGDIRFVDQDGNGEINDRDRTIIGSANPTVVWGITNTFQVGDFSLRVLVDSKIGQDIINAQRLRTLRLDGTQGNIPEDIFEDAFRPEGTDNPFAEPNPDGKWPTPRARSSSFSRFPDLVVEDGSYVRLKNVRIGYTFDEIPGTDRVQVFLNGTNLVTITDYSGFSPEVSAFGSASKRGVDLGSFPVNSSFEIGANFTF